MSRLQSALEATDLTPASLAKIPYLDACLKEAMRLQPPSPANLQRVCPPEGAVIDGRRIPGGTKVRLSNWAMQRDARYFEAPDVFWPERWLTSPSPAQPHTPRALFAFMIGPGTCVAKNLALMEMRLVRCINDFLPSASSDCPRGIQNLCQCKKLTCYLVWLEY